MNPSASTINLMSLLSRVLIAVLAIYTLTLAFIFHFYWAAPAAQMYGMK